MSGKKKKKIKEEVLATGIFQSVELIPGMFEALKGLLGSENTWRSFWTEVSARSGFALENPWKPVTDSLEGTIWRSITVISLDLILLLYTFIERGYWAQWTFSDPEYLFLYT